MTDDDTVDDRRFAGSETTAENTGTATLELSDDGPAVGDRVTFSKPLLDGDVRAFAAASGDTNRLHLDEAYAGRTRFDGPIVHGTLVGGLISAALARLPGLVVYLSQDLTFVAAVAVGDEPTADVEVVEALGDGRFRLDTTVVRGDGDLAVEGEAVVQIEDPPDDDSG